MGVPEVVLLSGIVVRIAESNSPYIPLPGGKAQIYVQDVFLLL
jgi:hypothetical protein